MLPNIMLRKPADDKDAVTTEHLMLRSACPLPGTATGAPVATACCPGDPISQPHLTPSHRLLEPPLPATLMPMQAFFFMFVTCMSRTCPRSPDP